jgi:VIT1/CCC1 family predicted Fe2+/Mn2+ transporter
MSAETVLQLVFTAVAAAIGAYVAVRVKLAELEARLDHAHERIGEVQASVTRAHERIDTLRLERAKETD